MRVVTLRLLFVGFIILAAAMLAVRPGAAGGDAAETRCGWFDNPTPGNASLHDREDEWIIGVQGGHQAEGDWPEFGPKQWVETNVHYGYGCACMSVTINRRDQTVTQIFSARPVPLRQCRADRKLPKP